MADELQDLKVALTALGAELKALRDMVERAEVDGKDNLRLAREEIARRLSELNNAHEKANVIQGRLEGTYLTIAKFDEFRTSTNDDIHKLENFNASLMGKMWLPMVMIAAAASAIVVGVVRLIIK